MRTKVNMVLKLNGEICDEAVLEDFIDMIKEWSEGEGVHGTLRIVRSIGRYVGGQRMVLTGQVVIPIHIYQRRDEHERTVEGKD